MKIVRLKNYARQYRRQWKNQVKMLSITTVLGMSNWVFFSGAGIVPYKETLNGSMLPTVCWLSAAAVSSDSGCNSKEEAGRHTRGRDEQHQVQRRRAEWLDGLGLVASQERTQAARVESRSVTVSRLRSFFHFFNTYTSHLFQIVLPP